jgi:ferric-dicitrate binding protein FerR (iron transport regulator)
MSIPITEITGISDSSTVITFSDGRVLNLVEEHIVYISDGEVSTNYVDNPVHSDLSYAETKFDQVTTPIGGQTTFILPDSTKVKLNGNSKLRFTNHLVDGQRYVELEGEAFFDVKKGKQPFIVQTQNQHIRVLGTSFNVCAYSDDPISSVALVSGAVKLSLSDDFIPSERKHILLHPGNVGVVNTGSRSLYLSDDVADDYLAWLHGRFEFDNESLGDIIHRLGRWYDVDIVFKDNVEKLKFTGSISRSETIQNVLDKLALTKKIKYHTKERRIAIMKN